MPRAYNDPTADAALGNIMREERQNKKHTESTDHPKRGESRRARWKKNHPVKKHTVSVWRENENPMVQTQPTVKEETVHPHPAERQSYGGDHDAGK